MYTVVLSLYCQAHFRCLTLQNVVGQCQPVAPRCTIRRLNWLAQQTDHSIQSSSGGSQAVGECHTVECGHGLGQLLSVSTCDQNLLKHCSRHEGLSRWQT